METRSLLIGLILQSPRALAADLPTDITALLTTPNPPAILALGDAIHGASSIQSLRLDATLAAIRTGRVGVVALEVNAPRARRADAYVRGFHDQPEDAVRALGYWFFGTSEMVDFLREVRAWNETAEHPVRIVGIDTQDAMAAWRDLDGALRARGILRGWSDALRDAWAQVPRGRPFGDWLEAGLAVPADASSLTVRLTLAVEGEVYASLGVREPRLHDFPTHAVPMEPVAGAVQAAEVSVPRQGGGPVRVRLHLTGEGTVRITDSEVLVDGQSWCAVPEAGLGSRLGDAPGAPPWTSPSTSWTLGWTADAPADGCVSLTGLEASSAPRLSAYQARAILGIVRTELASELILDEDLRERVNALEHALQHEHVEGDGGGMKQYVFRDTRMRVAVSELVEDHPDRVVVLLAHDQHLRRDVGMGAMLAHEHGDAYLPVAITVRRGRVRVRGVSFGGEWGTQRLQRLAPDAAERARWGPAGRLLPWPDELVRMRAMGTVPQDVVWFPYAPNAFEYVVVLPRTGPVEPLIMEAPVVE